MLILCDFTAAVMIDRDTAFAAAVAHELAPVSVH